MSPEKLQKRKLKAMNISTSIARIFGFHFILVIKQLTKHKV